MFKAPFLALVVAASMPLLFWFQKGLPDFGLSMAFRPSDLQAGQWSGLLTSMLLHGSWMHVVLNGVGALAFGTPVARLFSRGAGPAGFLALYIGSGAIAALGYGLVHYGSEVAVVGASGAVFGLIGASTRLMGPIGFIIPWNHPIVLRQAAAWMIANLVIGLVGLAPGMGGASIAWEAHAIGFVFGLFVVTPLARLTVQARRTDRGAGTGRE